MANAFPPGSQMGELQMAACTLKSDGWFMPCDTCDSNWVCENHPDRPSDGTQNPDVSFQYQRDNARINPN